MSWIKMRTDLEWQQEVALLSSRCARDAFYVVGALHAIWSIADSATSDGKLLGFTLARIDQIARCEGFGAAMVSVGWLIDHGSEGLEIPDFAQHNGASTKARLQAAKRVSKHRTLPKDTVTKVTPDRYKSNAPTVTPSYLICSDSDSCSSPSSGGEAGGGVADASNTLAPEQRWLPRYTQPILSALPKRCQVNLRDFWPAVAAALDRIQAGAEPTPVAGSTPAECIAWLAGRAKEYAASDEGRSQFAKRAVGWVSASKYLDPPEAWKRESTNGTHTPPARRTMADIHREREKGEYPED